jgi:putative copper export protein
LIDAALTAVGWLDLVASVILAGGLLCGAVIVERSAAGERTLRAAVLALVLALGLGAALTALRTSEVSGVRGASLVMDLAATRWAKLWALRALGLAVLASRTRAAVLLALPWLLLRSLQGHAGAHGLVPALVDWVHLGAATIWIGGLVQVAFLPRPVPVPVARRMRSAATAMLVLLVPAGVYGAVLHVQRWHMLLGSAYGRALVVKLALAAVLISLGAVNHFRHVPAMTRGDGLAATLLSRVVAYELVVAAAVLFLSALLGVLPMPHEHVGAGHAATGGHSMP